MRVTQPIRPENRRSISNPSASLMKRISPSKKVFPKKIACIVMRIRDAVAPMIGNAAKVVFKYMIRIIASEAKVKTKFLSRVIIFSAFSNLEVCFISYRSWRPCVAFFKISLISSLETIGPYISMHTSKLVIWV